MPKSIYKPIVCVCGSHDIDYIDLDLFIDPAHVGEIISSESFGIDYLAKDWAFKNKVEYAEFKPNYDIWQDKAYLERDKNMIHFCDIVIAFWSGKDDNIAYMFNYAASTGRRYIIHKIIYTD